LRGQWLSDRANKGGDGVGRGWLELMRNSLMKNAGGSSWGWWRSLRRQQTMGVSDGGVVGIDWEKKGETMDGGVNYTYLG
jgi:hypothetical protein